MGIVHTAGCSGEWWHKWAQAKCKDEMMLCVRAIGWRASGCSEFRQRRELGRWWSIGRKEGDGLARHKTARARLLGEPVAS